MDIFHYWKKFKNNQTNGNLGLSINLMIILMLLLTSCVGEPVSTLKPRSTITQTVTSMPTEITLSATPTVGSSSTITGEKENGPGSEQMINCLSGERSSHNNLQTMNGVILYSNEEKTLWYTLAGMPPLEDVISFPAILHDTVVFSPNGQWAVSYDDLPEQVEPNHALIQLIGPEGQSRTIDMDMSTISRYVSDNEAPSFSFQHWYFQWVNDQILLVRASYSETPDYGFPTYQYALYNVSLQAWWGEITEEIPDREPYSWLNVAPSLKLVLYRTTESNVALWDRDQKKIIWMQPGAADSDQNQYVSDWSPDSRSVTFEHFPDLMIISEEGNLIGTIEDIYLPEVNKYFQKDVIYEWSPDSLRLAFFVSTIEEGQINWKSSLYLYNLETGYFLYKCTLPEYNVSKINWSPDGNFVLTKIGGEEPSSFYIFNLLNSSFYLYRKSEIANLLWLPNYPLRLK